MVGTRLMLYKPTKLFSQLVPVSHSHQWCLRPGGPASSPAAVGLWGGCEAAFPCGLSLRSLMSIDVQRPAMADFPILNL